MYDRVPLAQDRIDSIKLLKRFLKDFGSITEIYSVQNEVGGLGPGTYSQSDMQNNGNGSPPALWWKDIVDTIQNEKISNPTLSHLKICSPSPILLKRLVFDRNNLPQTNVDFFYETIDFGNAQCDFIDFHFNVYSITEYEATLNFISPLVTKPMISTEWSAANFMFQSSSLLAGAGFKVLCWTTGWQQGLTAYDLRSLYATKTVASSSQNGISSLINDLKIKITDPLSKVI